jgi:hypothetical protein
MYIVYFERSEHQIALPSLSGAGGKVLVGGLQANCLTSFLQDSIPLTNVEPISARPFATPAQD